MKIKLLLISSLAFILASCGEESYISENAGKTKADQTERIRWYGTSVADMPTTKGVADQSKLWNVSVPIDVKFINSPSDPAIIEKIQNYAKAWEEYAGITFNFVPNNEKAVVRIAFDWNGNDLLTWSYTGNQARVVLSQNQPTAVFGGLQYLSEEELKGDVLRVFGQILGLEYEQRHLGWNDSWWKKDTNGNYYAQSYWETMFEGYTFDWELIRQFVFDPMSERNAVQTTEIDLESIMLWPYYTRIEMQDRTKLIANYELSENDKLFIAKLYPLEDRPILTMTTEPIWLDVDNYSIDNSGELFVDWGDGKKISYQSDPGYWYICPPEEWVQSGEERVVRVYGNAKDIRSLSFEGWQNRDYATEGLTRVKNIDFSKLTEIRDIGLDNIHLDKLNITNLANLGSVSGQGYISDLNISDCQNFWSVNFISFHHIVKINVSRCPILSTFYIYGYSDLNLDYPEMLESNHVFTDCPLLVGISMPERAFLNINEIASTKLTIAGCLQLTDLSYTNCGLVDVSIASDCENLQQLELARNKLSSINLPNCKYLNYLYVADNPIEDDREQIEKLAAQLPYAETGGTIGVSEGKGAQIESWIEEVISLKNWKISRMRDLVM